MRLIAGVVAAGLIVTGCSTADSKDIRTSGIKAGLHVTVKDHEQRADVLATLRAGTLTFVKLNDGESISASGGGGSVKLERHKSLGVTNYSGRLDGTLNAGTEVTFDLQRNSENDPAPRSVVSLPERVLLTAPANGTTYSRRAAIPVRFETVPTDQQTKVQWDGICVQQGEIQVPSGASSVVIPGGKITLVPPSTASPAGQSSTTCNVRITVIRTTTGSLDPAYKEGSVIGEAQSARDIVSTP
ncbi:hypothetical protein ACFTSF_32755 [Kribbella sp. NPDC056951]|uniref:hypothetical protein n=1 Tax=Kribbella sp. NPDC056951 TaxID=3345978 RepID=UPI00363B5B35